MFSENQGVILTIFTVIAVCIIALIGVIYAIYTTLTGLNLGTVEALEPDREVQVLDTQTNYNFAIPNVQEKKVTAEVVEQKKQEEPKKEETQQEQTSENKNNEPKPTYNFNFAIPKFPEKAQEKTTATKTQKQKYPAMKSIQIPSIGYDSPVIISNDGDNAVDLGAWQYPSNHPLKGESIFLCHRRYFKEFDPKSCWYLDRVQNGDDLFINFKDGSRAKYQIISITVKPGDDLNVYNLSDDKVIKLISCSKENGHIGSSTHRIVVIAKLVSYN